MLFFCEQLFKSKKSFDLYKNSNFLKESALQIVLRKVKALILSKLDTKNLEKQE